MTKINWGGRLIAWCGVCVSLFSAAPDVLADKAANTDLAKFDHIAAITEGQDAIRRVELPFDVLIRLKRADRKDLQVINANGETVPSKLFIDATSTTRETNSKKLAHFPVQRNTASSEQLCEI